MNRSHNVPVFLFLIVFICAAVPVFSQNFLQTNPNYLKAKEFEALAKQAYDTGDYDKSIEYAMKAEELSKTAYKEAELTKWRYSAYNGLRRAEERMTYADRINLLNSNPDLYIEALNEFSLAKTDFETEMYESSIEHSKKVITLLKDIAPVRMGTAEKPKAVLPATYEVRLIPERRDCFWRIAGYDFVYGDPLQWRHLYEANKASLPQPENPDLILPGMVLKIPSIKGEIREGAWKE